MERESELIDVKANEVLTEQVIICKNYRCQYRVFVHDGKYEMDYAKCMFKQCVWEDYVKYGG